MLDKWGSEDRDLEFCDRGILIFLFLDESVGSGTFFDLRKNPERFTGYSGESSWKVWDSIYRENYVIPPTWGTNVEEFRRRFIKGTVLKEEAVQWVKNLHLLYAVELRAIAKASKYLSTVSHSSYSKFPGLTGDLSGNDQLVLELSRMLENSKFVAIELIYRMFTNHFNESLLFKGKSSALKEKFRSSFRNISRIMDCVGCDKCRLWGKLQITGIGTALKILFSDWNP
ncbi:endoplasmic reticulum oxidoreductin-1-like, partial [Octopus sinensis]|uniref:Endoplasmic reticulum oxidoreductin-1-like n=1 Tax=Octopus sinensis TaxID=2607531 RepID=A0A6P7U1V8_9MOLL